VIWKKSRLHSYKLTATKELKETDHVKCAAYSKWFNDFITKNGVDILEITFFMKFGFTSVAM
jgi:hypothetical protein